MRYAARGACTGLQVLSRNQSTVQMRGIPIHATMATTSGGLPLSVWHCRHRDSTHGPLTPRAQRRLDA